MEALPPMRTLLPLLGVSLFSSAITFAGAMLAFPLASRAAPAAQPLPVVQAQRFDLLDANGTLRARLGVDPDAATTGLTIFDTNGQARASVSLGGDTAIIQTISPQGARATLSALPTGVVGAGMVDPNGTSRAGMGLAADGSPVVEVGHNLQGQPSPRVQLSDLPDGTLGLGIVDQAGRPRAGLAIASDGTPGALLLDAAGRPRVVAGLQADGQPTLRLQNESGQPIWVAPPSQ